jgi:hypothetical protein
MHRPVDAQKGPDIPANVLRFMSRLNASAWGFPFFTRLIWVLDQRGINNGHCKKNNSRMQGFFRSEVHPRFEDQVFEMTA